MDGQLLAKNLYRWARGNNERIAKIETWQDLALAEIVAGNGKEVVSTSGQGINITFSANQTNQDWFNTLTQALAYLQQGGPTNKTIGLIS